MENKFLLLILLFNISQILPRLSDPEYSYSYPLRTAIMECNFKKIERILSTGIDRRTYLGFIWLEDTINEKKINIDQARRIGVLLKKYVDINAYFAWTVLSRSVTQGELEVVKLYIEFGADINKPVKLSGNSKWCAKIDIKHTPLMLASRIGFPKIVQCLIKAGAKLDEKDMCGDTALMIAVKHNHPLIVYLLLINGADTTIVNIKDKPILINLYKEIKEFKRKKIYNTINKANGFNENMPDDLVDMISGYDC